MQPLNYANAIIKNIESKGLYRYDQNDIDAYLYHRFGVGDNTLFRKALRGIDIFSPVLLRKMLKIEKTANPTAYYHVGLAYLTREKYGLPIDAKGTATELAKEVIKAYYVQESGLWVHPYYARVTTPSACTIEKEGPFSMALHYVARLDIFLLALWKQYQIEEFLAVAIKSVAAIAEHHNIQDLGEGRQAISYYFNSLDNTLNISAEYLESIADIPVDKRPHSLSQLGHGILKMLLHEQNSDGSFFYVGKSHMEKYHIPQNIDGFHTAYMLNNLLHVYASDLFDGKERDLLLDCCIKGMEFYLSDFYNADTGTTIYALNIPQHKADIVCYSEGMVAFCTYLREAAIPTDLKTRIRRMMPKAMKNLLSMLSLEDGSAPSEYVLGRALCIDSVRWGNGPALQAIFDYMAIQQEGLLSE